MEELLRQIQQISKQLPHAQRLVAEYVLLNYSKIPFMTITNMAQEIGVSDTTIVNFCSMLGFDSFSTFKKIFVEHVQTELALYNNFENRVENINDKDTINQILNYDKTNIENTLTRLINKQNFEPFIDMLDNAKKIYTCGMRSSSILMDFLTQSLRIQGYDITTIALHGHFVDQLCQLTKEDLLINFCFSRYSSLSVKALEYASNKKIPCVSITDSVSSPTYRIADLAFVCETRSYSYQPSYVGVLSLLNAIILETSIRHKNRTKQKLKELEQALDYFSTFYEPSQ